MKTRVFVTLLSGACAVALSASANPKSDAAAAEIRTMFDQAATTFASCDTGNFGKYSAEGHTGFYPDSSALVIEASDENKQAEIAFCEGGGKHDLKYEIGDVVMLKDAALVLGTGHYKRTEPDGTVSVDTDYTFTDVMVKTTDGWKFRHSHVGAVMPAEEGAAPAAK